MMIFGYRNSKINALCWKKAYKIWNVNVDNNTVIEKLVKTKTYSKYLIGYLDQNYKTISFDNA